MTTIPRRGRPKADNSALITEVLLEWLGMGSPSILLLQDAVRQVAKERAKNFGVEPKSLRERINKAFREIGLENRFQLATEVANGHQRPIPEWLKRASKGGTAPEDTTNSGRNDLDGEPERNILCFSKPIYVTGD
jgi:hypothetical protein